MGGSVAGTLALDLAAAPTLGAFTPGVAKDYEAGVGATITSTAGDATLSIADTSATAPGNWSTARSRSLRRSRRP